MEQLSVLIVDDHDAVRRSIRLLLSARTDWSVCGEARDGVEAVEKTKALRPDLVLMDISMPKLDGIEATRIIRREMPASKVIIVSQNDPALVRRHAVEVDAHGCVEKAAMARDLIPAIEKLTVAGKSTSPQRVDVPLKEEWLFGGGQLGRLIREFDWSRTPLGPIGKWPQSLRTAVNLILNSQHPMWIGWGREMTFLYNDAYISVLSLAKHPKSLGQPAGEVWAEIWDFCGPLAEKVLANGEPSFEEVRLFMSRGDYLEETYYSFSYSPIHDESGRVGGLFCPSTETTAKVLHARRLRTLSELSAKALVDKSVQSACDSALATLAENPDDIPFALLYMSEGNPKTIRLIGNSRISPDAKQILVPELSLGEGNRDEGPWPVRRVISSALSEVVPVDTMNALPCGAADQAVKDAIVMPLLVSDDDRPVGVLIAGINPTRKLDTEYRTFFQLVADQVATAIQHAKAMEAEKRRVEALAEIDRAKTVFFSNVSHEFRTPLTLMLGPLEDVLSGATEMSQAQRDRLKVAHRNSLRLLKLVNALLDFSRIEAGRIEAWREPTDLATFTTDLASVFRSTMEGAGLRFLVNCETLDRPVNIDREMWEKIVFNLLSNAFKFTFTGEVEISLRNAGEMVELGVRDTGTGIPESEIPHVFERFHRVKGAQGRTFEGSGIGLALIQELVKLHGGSVRVESEINRGSTFTVSIPKGDGHLAHAGISRPAVSRHSGTYVEEALSWSSNPEGETAAIHELKTQAPVPTTTSARILLADDNADMREYVRGVLCENGYVVEAVADGEEALEVAKRGPPDLVLTDVMMPRLDGFGLLEGLRSDESTATIPVILLSARAGEESRVEGISSGADDYLIKPFSARELVARVEAHLKLARLRREAEARVRENEEKFRHMLDALPAAIYTTDAEGRLTHFNPAAIKFSGRVPELGKDKWCVSWKIYRSDGTPLPLDQCPMALTVKEGKIEEGGEFIAERPDGTRIWFSPYPRTLRDAEGKIIGGINMLVDISERKRDQRATGLLAAIVDSSDDAIVSKNLDGVITSWNKGAERLFGYTADEAIGQNIILVIPADHRDEERAILERIRSGLRVEPFETIRKRKDGTLFDVALTISPVKDSQGHVMGASKLARDITERKRVERILEGTAKQHKALYQLADQLHRARSLEDVYDCSLEAILGALQCERASILIYDDKLVMRFVSWRGLSEGYRKVTEGHSPWKPDAVAPEPVWVDDAGAADFGQLVNSAVKGEGIRALAFIPLVSHGKLIGKFMMYFNRPHAFSQEEKELSLTIARQLAFGIDRRQAEEELRESEVRFRRLAETLDAEVRIRTEELEQRKTDVERQSERLRDLSQRLMQSRDDERRRVARELHDSAGQTLTVLAMTLARLTQNAEQNAPELLNDSQEGQNLVQQLSQEIRTMSYLLHPPLLDESGLVAALSWYVQGLEERSGVDIELLIPQDFGRLPRELELVIFRLVQECLTNIHRHSESRDAVIRVVRDAENVILEVSDHGKGMSPERLAEVQARSSGVGIRGMRERVRQFHGKMNIDSNASGTRVSVVIPLPEPGQLAELDSLSLDVAT